MYYFSCPPPVYRNSYMSRSVNKSNIFSNTSVVSLLSLWANKDPTSHSWRLGARKQAFLSNKGSKWDSTPCPADDAKCEEGVDLCWVHLRYNIDWLLSRVESSKRLFFYFAAPGDLRLAFSIQLHPPVHRSCLRVYPFPRRGVDTSQYTWPIKKMRSMFAMSRHCAAISFCR